MGVEPCEDTICANPNYGGGNNPNGEAQPKPAKTPDESVSTRNDRAIFPAHPAR